MDTPIRPSTCQRALIYGLTALVLPLMVARARAQEPAPQEENGTQTEVPNGDASATPTNPGPLPQSPAGDILSTALEDGNQLFRGGQIEAAVDVYQAGFRPDQAQPILAYNLGTALHHLNRLPEAILWYRRAGSSDDPWLEDNLWLARRTLGSQRLPAQGLFGRLVPSLPLLRGLGIALAWTSLLLVVLARRTPSWAPLLCATLAFLTFGAAVLGQHLAPREGVLLKDCTATGLEIPAGSEVWVRPVAGGGWRLATGSQPITCPSEAVALVFPR